MADPIKLKIQLTPEDYAQAEFLHLSPWRLFVITLFLVIILASTFDLIWTNDFASLLIFVPCGIYGCFCFSSWRIRRKTAKQFKHHKGLQIAHEVDCSKDQFFRSSERGEARVPWDDFHKWKGNRKIILIYPAPRLYYAFPRRFFASDEMYQEMERLLAEKIGPRGKARKRD